jgi:hypothetical protein
MKKMKIADRTANLIFTVSLLGHVCSHRTLSHLNSRPAPDTLNRTLPSSNRRRSLRRSPAFVRRSSCHLIKSDDIGQRRVGHVAGNDNFPVRRRSPSAPCPLTDPDGQERTRSRVSEDFEGPTPKAVKIAQQNPFPTRTRASRRLRAPSPCRASARWDFPIRDADAPPQRFDVLFSKRPSCSPPL